MCTSNRINSPINRRIAIIVILLCAAGRLSAQEVLVGPIKPTTPPLLQASVYLYAGGGFMTDRSLQVAGSNSMRQGALSCAYSDAGAMVALYTSNVELLHINTYVGYKYQTHNFSRQTAANAGIDAHWLSLDIGPEFGSSFAGAGIGVKADVLLHSKVRNSSSFVYEGIYEDCFNKVALSGYYALHYEFFRFRLEYRMGMYFIPHLDPQRVAYYNHTPTATGGLYFEFRAYYRLFTTGKEYYAKIGDTRL